MARSTASCNSNTPTRGRGRKTSWNASPNASDRVATHPYSSMSLQDIELQRIAPLHNYAQTFLSNIGARRLDQDELAARVAETIAAAPATVPTHWEMFLRRELLDIAVRTKHCITLPRLTRKSRRKRATRSTATRPRTTPRCATCSTLSSQPLSGEYATTSSFGLQSRTSSEFRPSIRARASSLGSSRAPQGSPPCV